MIVWNGAFRVSVEPVGPNTKGGFAQRMETALVARIGHQRYFMWFPMVTFVPMGRELMIVVPNDQAQDWISHTFGQAIREAANEVLQTELVLKYVVENGLLSTPSVPAAPNAKAQLNLFDEPRPLPAKPESKKPEATSTSKKKPGRRFRLLSDFVVGACNRVAHASALSVVEEPGQGANPLVVYGPTGTGKTHILEGIYAGLRKLGGDFTPTFVTAEDFTTRFVQAARFNKQGQFRRQFRECGVLLLDDLHFLATKRLTQEEFLHTFDVLQAEGKQIVVTMDCHPRHAEELLPELTDRLLGGAVWGILPPDDATRLDILRKKSTGQQPSMSEEVLRFLADNLHGNVRELEGAINSVRHFARVINKPVSVNLAREALGDLLRHSVRVVTVKDVDAAVCEIVQIPSGTLQSKGRTWNVSHPRMLAIFLARKHTSATYGEIAAHFGVKTHSTPVAAEKKVREWIQNDHKLTLAGREWKTRDLLARIERSLAK
ncbi:MAG: DnaA ATPase domain-containing protein [Fimbriiglobus sp.]